MRDVRTASEMFQVDRLSLLGLHKQLDILFADFGRHANDCAILHGWIIGRDVLNLLRQRACRFRLRHQPCTRASVFH